MRTIETHLDLDRLRNECRLINNKINSQYTIISDSSDLYNVFLFPYDGIHELYEKVCLAFWDVNDDYEDPYYIHAWLHYQQKGQTIPWHYHWKGRTGLSKTFVATFYVNAEPSITTHEFANGHILERVNENNTIVIAEDKGDRQMVSEWDETDNRILISMDFVPMKYIQDIPYVINTWIPIL